jgi:arylsulfatase A-like enzyme
MSPKVSRRTFIEATVAATALAAGCSQGAQRRPNVLFILADDLGYGDLSCYGRPDYRTPALDRLARQGVRFTSNYAAAPICTPTRCAYITGRYPQRLPVGLAEPLTSTSPRDLGLPPDHPTIASLLKANGYETALVGKWHLGWKPEFGPNRHGFDDFFGILSGAADYFTHRASDAPDADPCEGRGRRPLAEPDAHRARRLPHRFVDGQGRRVHRAARAPGRSFSACNTRRRTHRGRVPKTKRSATRHTDPVRWSKAALSRSSRR